MAAFPPSVNLYRYPPNFYYYEGSDVINNINNKINRLAVACID